MKPQRKLMLCCLLFPVLFACRKTIYEGRADDAAVQNAPADRSTALAAEVTRVLEQVYRSDAAYLEVNAAVYSGFYHDERVLLDDLVDPSESLLYRSPAFRSMNADTGVFRRVFCEIIEKGGYPLLKEKYGKKASKKRLLSATVQSDLKMPQAMPASGSLVKGIAIYFPYSENFVRAFTGKNISTVTGLAPGLKATLVHADRDADAATGRAPYWCAEGTSNTCYREQFVDDAYADRHPTHIITTGAELKENNAGYAAAVSPVNTVYHGWSVLTRQMDKLISFTGNGGGSEIKVARIDGYLKFSDQQVTNFAGDLVTVHYSRGDIRRKRWKRVMSVWDPNWNYQNTHQVYAVWEEDTQGTKTFNGSLSTTLNLPGKPSPGKVQGEIGFKIQVTTQDELITQRELDRSAYFRDAAKNQGWGYVQDPNDFLAAGLDWPVYDGGTVWSYTMPNRGY